MKKNILVLALFAALASNSMQGVRSYQEIPTAIALHNSSTSPLDVAGTQVLPRATQHFENAGNSFAIKQGDQQYKISYKNSEQGIKPLPTTANLDFTTIQWLAGDMAQHYPHGLDEIKIANDTLYKVATMYVLNKKRSYPKTIQPRETASNMVGILDTQSLKSGNKSGTLVVRFFDELATKQHAIFHFTRAMPLRTGQKPWNGITLCANTLKWFANGFSVMKEAVS